jgi:hypothetical protein
MRYTLIVFFISINFPGIAQDSLNSKQFNISAGYDQHQAYSIGLKYQRSQFQFALTYGTTRRHDQYDEMKLYSISVYKHLFGKSKWSYRKPWFVRTGASFRDEVYYQDLFANLYFGRDINFSRYVGLAISCGPAFQVWLRRKQWSVVPQSFIQPRLEFAIFYRII